AKGFESIADLMARVAALLRSCPCESGCPSCVHSPKCGNGNNPLDKGAALELAESLLAGRPGGAGAERAEGGGPGPLPGPRAGTRARAGVQPIDPRPSPRAPIVTLGRGTDDEPNPAPVRRSGGGAAPARETTLFLDVETQRSAEEVGGWGNIAAMKVALAVTY